MKVLQHRLLHTWLHDISKCIIAKQAFMGEIKLAAKVSQDVLEEALAGFGQPGELKVDSQESSSSGAAVSPMQVGMC